MIRKKEGFEGQRAVILPRKIVTEGCAGDPVIGGSISRISVIIRKRGTISGSACMA